eukprot:GDKH01002068.1.p4 GENE.GDKH01002068.1~~GDKH01002068.1.p4  ORF type:complete len:56 (+),score=3.35 GDKH01002068.1:366-533(+)
MHACKHGHDWTERQNGKGETVKSFTHNMMVYGSVVCVGKTKGASKQTEGNQLGKG